MDLRKFNFSLLGFGLMFVAFLAENPVQAQVQAAGQGLRVVENTAFSPGEKLVFRAFYSSALTGNVTAGEASLEILETTRQIGGRSTMPVVGLMRTRGVFNLFFRVNNHFETYIDRTAIAPLRFIRRIEEGRYRKNEEVLFNHFDRLAISQTATVPIPAYVQDIISAFYFARTYKFDNPKIGDEFSVDFFLADSVYVTRIVFDGYEQIITRLGTFNALRFKPMVLRGKVFSQPYPMTLWISDDKNRVPLLVESGLVVGRVKLELSEFHRLKNPLTSRIR